jgi:hypothetical protein
MERYMKTRAIVGVALAGAAILVSCTQDRTSAPMLPTEASFARTAPINYCSFSTITNTAKDYFADRNDEVYGLIAAMNTAYKAGGADGATSAGFDVLARLGVATDAGAVKSPLTAPATGSAFANAVLKCMTVAGFTPGDGEIIPFSSSLGPDGLFAVRSNSQNTAVYSRGRDENGLPLFGAEPTLNTAADPDNSNWPIVSSTGKALIHGWKTAGNTAQLGGEDLSSVSFELKTLPAPLTFNPKIRVGVCSVEDQAARTIHKHTQTSILAPGGLLSFCDGSVASISPNLGSFAYVTRQLSSWFAPKPLFAAPVAFGGGGAGLVGGLSEFGAVEFTPSILWTVPPVERTTLSAQFPTIKVTVTTVQDDGITPLLPYVGWVKLNVVGNQGIFVISGDSVDTDATGLATFNALKILKAGGYTMTAVTGIGTSAPVTFWINGQ